MSKDDLYPEFRATGYPKASLISIAMNVMAKNRQDWSQKSPSAIIKYVVKFIIIWFCVETGDDFVSFDKVIE